MQIVNKKFQFILTGSLSILVLIIAVYWGIMDYDFINYDDNMYVYENNLVQKGITTNGLIKSFSEINVNNWHPLTMLSHMLDFQLFGNNAGMHHLISVILHIINSILLFLTFTYMTRNATNSLLVAVLFAIHPMHIESVAWISERKDVLSTFFWLLTMLIYTWYAKYPGVLKYIFCLFVFSLGLMSKPMLVTLPFVLILIDLWPLDRLKFTSDSGKKYSLIFAEYLKKLAVEKIPFFLLSFVLCVITLIAQDTAVKTIGSFSYTLRVSNAIIAYMQYIFKCFWPVKLAVFYPYPEMIPLVNIILSLLVLFTCSYIAVGYIKRKPYLFMGWFWFLGTLIPVIGIIQVGDQSMADRYTYIPYTGLFVIIVWYGNEFISKYNIKKRVAWCFTVISILFLTVVSYQQVRYWKNSFTLFENAIANTKDNYLAYAKFGEALNYRNEMTEAIKYFKRAISIKPDFAFAHNNWGYSLFKLGDPGEAIQHFKDALKYAPYNKHTLFNLSVSLVLEGHFEEAVQSYKKTLEVAPDMFQAHFNLGNLYNRKGFFLMAEMNYQKAVTINPEYDQAYYNLAVLQMEHKELKQSITSFNEVLRIKPNHSGALNNSGLVLENLGQYDDAINKYRNALLVKPDYIDVRNNLGNALLKKGQINEAIKQYKIVLKSNPEHINARENLEMVYSVLENRRKKSQVQ